jgi:hypothetical protein
MRWAFQSVQIVLQPSLCIFFWVSRPGWGLTELTGEPEIPVEMREISGRPHPMMNFLAQKLDWGQFVVTRERKVAIFAEIP